jgi:hypothetical protein
MGSFDGWAVLIQACAPIIVALAGIMPTIINNRKKTQASIDELRNSLNAHIKEEEADKVRRARMRIIRFNDDLCANVEHSESFFEDILDDVDTYEAYCAAHPDFKNGRGNVAMDHVKAVYAKLKTSGKFLTFKEG